MRLSEYYKTMKILGKKVKFKSLTKGETILWQTMHDCKDFNKEDFEELLEFAKNRAIDSHYEYNEILKSMAMLKIYLELDNKKLKIITDKLFKVSSYYALDLLVAASRIGIIRRIN